MSALQQLLNTYRNASVTEREKGTYFEELIVCYLRNEATYRDLYSDVWTYAQWADLQGLDKRDAGIDLVARTQGTGDYHAIQCKLYAENYRLQKADIDSFFTASGKKPFSHRLIVCTTNHWSEHAENALADQQPPVSKIDLTALEESQINWAQYAPKAAPVLKAKKELREHQQNALAAVLAGLQGADRGKLIMACGTGKTFTSLKIAEAVAGAGKRVLFLVPSLSLLSQTLTEWTQESATPLHSFAVCSDSDVGKKRTKEDDAVQTFVHELRYPATTNPERLALEMAQRHDGAHMSVVFSTYHSIEVISQAQQRHGLAAFDLIVCDEAHRTTGATFADEDESAFVKVHDAGFIHASKRLYMTATPRIYGDSAKVKAEQGTVTLCSMDDEALFGPELFVITFSEAVRRGLLVDYKVIVLSVEESHVSRRLQNLLKDAENTLKVDDAAKIVGCWKALAKQGMDADLHGDEAPMKRAVAFCQVIEPSKLAKTHKVSSKNIAAMFQDVVEAYQDSAQADGEEIATRLTCEAEHVDGGMNASEKESKLAWLKADAPDNTCRVLSNVRCLSEGVDVPALDAVLFLTPRNSQVDVVQSVGRVMRNAPGKTRGYVVLPVVIPAGVEPHDALNDNKTYAVVWQVLQALRSHDDQFDAMVNKLDLIGQNTRKMEVIAITDKVQRKAKTQGGKTGDMSAKKKAGKGQFQIGAGGQKLLGKDDQTGLEFEIGEIEKAIYAKLVKKVGNPNHWEDWANDIAKIARTHIDRITGIIENPENGAERAAFDAFAAELRDDLNGSITDGEVVEMLAQHLITKPVFDALFKDYSFAQHNPISKAMQRVLDVLHEHRLEKEADTLQRFYDSVKMRASDIDSATGKQKIVVELYDKFFANAFPRLRDKLGIVYTPVEVVDFIIHSVDHILRTEFGQTLGSEGVHIIDPFVGTGTFITRLLQSGLITPEQLPRKYKNEIHANELVLLAYYIAAINIEAVYHSIVGGEYVPFEGICLTDTFQMYEQQKDLVHALDDNSARRKRQKTLDIRVIVGNPPYSIGQESADDNNQNASYRNLDSRIEGTYVAQSIASNSRGTYDSYIRAIRWASDRIGHSGVIGFVTNAGFMESGTADGLRKCLADEFSSIYVFHLRGNARTSGELRRKEKDNVFGLGSRAPIAISLLVKNPNADEHGKILFHDIGDYLSREKKLRKISDYVSVAGVSEMSGWTSIFPDQYGDWFGQRDSGFLGYIAIGGRDGGGFVFENFSLGVGTNRDVWCYNFSRAAVDQNARGMINFYNNLVSSAWECGGEPVIDPANISWTRSMKKMYQSGKKITTTNRLVESMYRPYTKEWLCFNRQINEYVFQFPKIFPSEGVNFVIAVSAKGAKSFSALISDCFVDLNAMEAGAQCFPLYLYDETTEPDETRPSGAPQQSSLFAQDSPDLFEAATAQPAAPKYTRRDAITDEGLAHFQEAYPGENISKEDLFYYVYGLLHSPDYRERYADNLSKELPRIPRVKTAAHFWAFSKAGRALAHWHLNYETVEPYPVTLQVHGSKPLAAIDYRVEKMKYPKKGKEKDLTTLIYNERITLTGIPLEAYDYVVNGKPALDWVVERQCVKVDKDSGIANDANDWALETMKNPRYPLELFQRVITVSLETMKIVNSLPALDI